MCVKNVVNWDVTLAYRVLVKKEKYVKLQCFINIKSNVKVKVM